MALQLWIPIVAAAAILVWLLPRHGGRARLRRWRALQHRIRVEDALKHLLHCERAGTRATHESLAGVLGVPVKRVPSLVAGLARSGLLAMEGGGFSLTGKGREYALQILRAHRLWERYLTDEAGFPLTRLHGAAERAEHRLSPEEVDELEAHLGHPRLDPHGDPIPTARGEIEPLDAVPLAEWPEGTEAEVRHLEDEPQAVFEEICDLGLRAGQVVRVLEADQEGLRLELDGKPLLLSPLVAANVHVGPVVRPSRPEGLISLTELEEGVEAEVVDIDPAIRGFTRRRLMDLGITPGVRIRAELTPPFGRPRAYRVRECLLALREDQTDWIWVRPLAAAAGDGTEGEAGARGREGREAVR